MTGIKLSKLPERAQVRLTINISPDINRALAGYAEFYRATYGQEESIAELLPAIVGAFLESDKAFVRWFRDATDRNE